MRVKYDIEIPEKSRLSLEEEREAILDFARSARETMQLEYDTFEDAAKRYTPLSMYLKRTGMPIKMSKRSNSLYIYKVGKVDSLPVPKKKGGIRIGTLSKEMRTIQDMKPGTTETFTFETSDKATVKARSIRNTLRNRKDNSIKLSKSGCTITVTKS